MSEDKDIDALFRYDPFAEESTSIEQNAGGQEAAGSEDADGAGEAGSEQPESAGAEQSEDSAAADDGTAAQTKPDESGEPEKGEKDKEIERLREQLNQTSETVKNLQQQVSQPQQSQGTEASGSGPKSDEVPDYMFQMPESVANSLVSEDLATRQNALSQLVSGIGKSVHSTLQAQFREELEERVSQVQQETQQQTQNTSQVDTIRKDYFGQNPQHDSDLVRPLVQRKSQEVMNEWNVQKWTAGVRDEISRRVNAELQNAGMGPQPQPQPQTQGNGQAGAPHMKRGNSRPATSGNAGPNSSQDIESTLFG